VVGGERHLRGADQIEVVRLQPVDLAGVGTQEAGALHGGRLDQHRGDHRREAVLGRVRQCQLQQAELQQRTHPGQVVEPRARHLRAPLDVDRAEQLTQRQVVAGGVDRGPGADLAQHHEVLLAAVRRALLHQVRYGQVGHSERAVGLGGRRLGDLHLRGELLGTGDQRGLLFAGGLGQPLRELLLLGAQRLEPLHRLAAGGIGPRQRVDHPGGFATRQLAGPQGIRVVTQQSQVNHAGSLSGRVRPPRTDIAGVTGKRLVNRR
jgi:hypothetical protein